MTPKLYLIAYHTWAKTRVRRTFKPKKPESDRPLDLLCRFSRRWGTAFCRHLPPDLTLEEKISWINKRRGRTTLSPSCHSTRPLEKDRKGALIYYYGGSQRAKRWPKSSMPTAAYWHCQRGVQPDTASRFERLGIVRYLRLGVLLELGSINNDLPTVKANGVKAFRRHSGRSRESRRSAVHRCRSQSIRTFEPQTGRKKRYSGYMGWSPWVDEPSQSVLFTFLCGKIWQRAKWDSYILFLDT